MSGDVEVAYSGGRRGGTSAPYQRATSAISSESVDTTTRSKAPRSAAPSRSRRRAAGDRRAAGRSCAARAPIPRARGTNATARRAPHREAGCAGELGQRRAGTPSRSAARAPRRRSRRARSGGPPRRRAPRGRRLRDLVDDRPLRGRTKRRLPSALRHLARLGYRGPRRGASPSRSLSSPTALPEAAHAAASGAIRASLCHRIRFALPYPHVDSRLAQDVGDQLDLTPREALRRDRDDWRSRRLDDLDTPRAVRLEVRDASRRDPVTEALAQRCMCSRPFSSGTTTPSATASGSTR